MSSFWSGWVIFLMVLNLGITLFLFVCSLRIRIPTAPDGTTGHVWAHGVLREGVRKLPLWWVVVSISVFICGGIYLALYPGFGSSKGLLGWTSSGEWLRDHTVVDAKLETLIQPSRALSIEQLAEDRQATGLGQRLYEDNCAACHGRDAHGNRALGAPNLTDAEWMYGGDGETILASVLDGRAGVMPPWGPALGEQGVDEVVAYVLSFGGYRMNPDRIAAGKTRYDTLCVACHGADGRGNQTLGAPNLTDDIWLYGSSFGSIADSVRDGRGGVMPAWRKRLREDQARAVAAWVYANGGHGPIVSP